MQYVVAWQRRGREFSEGGRRLGVLGNGVELCVLEERRGAEAVEMKSGEWRSKKRREATRSETGYDWAHRAKRIGRCLCGSCGSCGLRETGWSSHRRSNRKTARRTNPKSRYSCGEGRGGGRRQRQKAEAEGGEEPDRGETTWGEGGRQNQLRTFCDIHTGWKTTDGTFTDVAKGCQARQREAGIATKDRDGWSSTLSCRWA